MTDTAPLQTSQGLHVAVIMDGNGRWASACGLPRVAGHRAGVLAARRVVEQAVKSRIRRLTLYAFSSDNWKRPAFEVGSILQLLRIFLRVELDRLRNRGVRFQVIGRRDRLPRSLLQEIERTEALTCDGKGLCLCVAIDYSSRDAISRAIACAASLPPNTNLALQDTVRILLTQTLSAGGGEVDLLIRTGGEKRLSDFLLWESAYAELVFTDRMWPDFSPDDFEAALDEFRSRERRFGGVPVPAAIVAERQP